MGSVIDKTRNVVLGHLGQLLLEDALEVGQDDETLAFVIVVDNAELDFAIAFLNYGGLQLKLVQCRLQHE